MERQFFSGNTLEQAVLAAARHYDLDPERVAYKLRDKKHGFLNIRRRVVIEVDPSAPEQTEEMRAEQESAVHALDGRERDSRRRDDRLPGGVGDGRNRPQRQERPTWRGQEMGEVVDGDVDREQRSLEMAVEDLGGLAGVAIIASIRREDDGYEIELSGPESKALRDNRGGGLGAMEHLLPRMVRGLSGHGVPCRVDSQGFRVAHEDELKRLAQRTAEAVRHELEERRLEPMNPADRRVVHMALADDPAVRTESEGGGFLKRVRIVPS